MADSRKPPADSDDASRESARLAWEKGLLEQGDSVGPPDPLPDDDLYVPVRPRAAFPLSFKLLLAAGLAFLAIEPTAELGYSLLGAGEPIDLGYPANYRLDAAVDGARVKISGFASGRRGTYSEFSHEYEVVALTAIPVLVRREPQPAAPPSSVELYQGEGRLLKLGDAPGSFFERVVRPATRYGTVKSTFVTYGEIPPGRTTWLLLDGDLPRARPWAIALPILLWLAVVALLVSAARAWLRARPETARP